MYESKDRDPYHKCNGSQLKIPGLVGIFVHNVGSRSNLLEGEDRLLIVHFFKTEAETIGSTKSFSRVFLGHSVGGSRKRQFLKYFFHVCSDSALFEV